MRGSRVSMPLSRRVGLWSPDACRSARAMPRRIAPAWPEGPPPSTLTITSYLVAVSVARSGSTACVSKFGTVMYSSILRSLTVSLPVPGTRRTRATLVLRRPVPKNALVLCSAIKLHRERLWFLCGVRVLWSAINFQLGDDLPAEAVFRDHAAYGALDDRFGMPG